VVVGWGEHHIQQRNLIFTVLNLGFPMSQCFLCCHNLSYALDFPSFFIPSVTDLLNLLTTSVVYLMQCTVLPPGISQTADRVIRIPTVI
jgi:hypothetical protein